MWVVDILCGIYGVLVRESPYTSFDSYRDIIGYKIPHAINSVLLLTSLC